MATMTRTRQCSAAGPLLMALELGQQWWKVGFTTEAGQRPWVRRIAAGALEALTREVASAKQRWGLASAVAVESCYEAGRDGFWLHRWLVAQGITNRVVDSASIEVSRRARRAKTDRLDVCGLLTSLDRAVHGDGRVWHVVHVPTVTDEDARQLHRSLATLQADRTRLINRLKGVMAATGLRLPVTRAFEQQLATARLIDGTPTPAGAVARLRQVWAQLRFVEQQLVEGEAARAALPLAPATATARSVVRLQQLRAIGPVGAWTLSTEIFGWRAIRNGRQLGALVGLVSAPYDSGQTHRDQGITHAGNATVRTLMVQLAWSWVRYQPASALTQWYQQRFGGRGPRAQRLGIVAVARRLLMRCGAMSTPGSYRRARC
jgi:transposase